MLLTCDELEFKCRSFLDEYVPFNGDKLFVAGGVFSRIYHDLPIRDIDVFVNDDKTRQDVTYEYLNHGWIHESVHGCDMEQISRFTRPDSNISIDLISFHLPRSVDWILKFDYYHCMFAMVENSFFAPQFGISLFALENKKLIPNNKMNIWRSKNNNPLTRMKKWQDLGFTIEDENLTALYNILVLGKFETRQLPY